MTKIGVHKMKVNILQILIILKITTKSEKQLQKVFFFSKFYPKNGKNRKFSFVKLLNPARRFPAKYETKVKSRHRVYVHSRKYQRNISPWPHSPTANETATVKPHSMAICVHTSKHSRASTGWPNCWTIIMFSGKSSNARPRYTFIVYPRMHTHFSDISIHPG